MLPRSLLALLVAAVPAYGRPVHKQALANHFGPTLNGKLVDCRTCHLPGEGDEKPHNPFGKRLAEWRDILKDKGIRPDLPARLDAAADEDSDGDGSSNLAELLLGHSPGDAADKPTDAEKQSFAAKKVAFDAFRAAYPWRPFEKVQRPAVPVVANAGWVRNPIDAFIAAEHESRGLKPRPEAPKSVLLRRIHLDLVGLPPTRDELHAFLDDPSPDAYERAVDRLLQSPQYGERWGRHWMDVWRYSDWAGWGNQVRDSQPHVWRWRDWIVDSLNADKPYDRMIVEMLAGDEAAPLDEDALRATGYLARNYKLLSREKWMQDVVDHTFQAFQGLTLGCARCHDHMYDPVTQNEYYRVRAVFEPHNVRTDRVPGQPDVTKNGLVRAFDKDLGVKTVLFIRGDDRTPDKTPLEPGVPASLGGTWPATIAPVNLPVLAQVPDRRPFVIRDDLDAAEAAVKTAAPVDADLAGAKLRALQAVLAVEELEAAGDTKSERWKQLATAANRAQRELAVQQAKRAVFAAQGVEAVAKANQAVQQAETASKAASSTYTKRALPTYPATSTGRRLALANWIANRDNPLTARVAMNHVWLRHFGAGIVPNVFDFGRNGRPATHPALLDWLAAEFVDQGWSMRRMHKLMLMSSTYRQASTPDESNLVKDRDNVYLWRANSRRLEAELVRDQVFYVAGRLDLTQGGPEIDHTLGLTVPRRSVYFRHAAEKQMEFLKIFDAAGVTECYQRKDSVIPQQAMALSNSDLTIRHSRLLARKLVGDDAAFARSAFETVLARPATDDEVATCVQFLTEQATKLPKGGSPMDADGKAPAGDPAIRARENLVLVLMNHHDFVTVR